MARERRIEFTGAVYHITARGNRKENIFFSDDDRELFLRLFSKTVDDFDWICHGYCLMGNHYHLLVETTQPNLSRGMSYLNGNYAKKFNYYHEKIGHLFQRRFWSSLVEKDDHLLEVSRYIQLNPVRAGLTDNPKDWPWSSYSALVGLINSPQFLSRSWTLKHFSNDAKIAAIKYAEFIGDGIGMDLFPNGIPDNSIIGSSSFVKVVKKLQSAIGGNKQVRTLKQIPACSLNDIFGNNPHEKGTVANLIKLARNDHGFKVSEIANHLHISRSAVYKSLLS